MLAAGGAAALACGSKLEGDPNGYTNGFANGQPPAAGGSAGTSATMSGGTNAMGGVSTSTAGTSAATASGGSSTGTNTANTIPPDDACLQTAFSQCVGCHEEGGALSSGVDLKSTNIGMRLAGKVSTYPAFKVINQDMPLESMIYLKIANGACIAAGTCGQKMPFTGTVGESDINCIRDWLLKF